MKTVVYFIEAAPGIKIGYSGDHRARLYPLKLKYGQDIKIPGVIEGNTELETALHKHFDQHAEIYSYIQSHASQDYTPYLYNKYAVVNIPYSIYKLRLLLSEVSGEAVHAIGKRYAQLTQAI
jgi:hypothetical protein